MVSFVFAMDWALGRFNIESLDDQTLMEMLLENTKASVQDRFKKDGEFLDMREWHGIRCNENGDVQHIKIANRDVSMYFDESLSLGKIALQYIPRHTETFFSTFTRFSGTLETAALPQCLRHLDLTKNALTGSVNLSVLPPAMTILDLNGNKLSNSICLESLPASLKVLVLNQNFFTGFVSLDHLPHSLQELNLSQNELQGSLCMRSLPDQLQVLKIAENKFNGEIDFANTPPNLRVLEIFDNALSGSVCIMQEKALRVFFADQNRFTGVAVIPKVLEQAEAVDLDENNITAVLTPGGEAYPSESSITLRQNLSVVERRSKRIRRMLAQ